MDSSLFFELFTQADHFLVTIATNYGALIYVVMFSIFFLETGVVVMAFLPGDSLLFVAGAVTATGVIDPWILSAVVIVGASLGNTTNYMIGNWLGQKIYHENFAWIDRTALDKTHAFYLRHGGKTVFLSRFIPIVRSFAPLVAGAGSMPKGHFQFYSVTGAVAWGAGLIWAGNLFGNIPFIKDHLTTILILGISCALVPTALIALWKFATSRRKNPPA